MHLQQRLPIGQFDLEAIAGDRQDFFFHNKRLGLFRHELIENGDRLDKWFKIVVAEDTHDGVLVKLMCSDQIIMKNQ